MPENVVPQWEQSDLMRRVIAATDVARQMLTCIADALPASSGGVTTAIDRGGLLREKVVAETALLLYSLWPIRSIDERIREQTHVLADLLVPHARHDDVLAAICLDPGLARDHAVAHAILSHLGFPDAKFDHILSKSLSLGPDFGPERLPHRRLEQAWLSHLWNVIHPSPHRDPELVADSILGRPMDALGSKRLDIYAFTHAIMYATDLGRRGVPGTRDPMEVASDADAALGYCLDSNDYDLTAEVLMTWPMLGLAWSPAATFAFGILAKEEDTLGFLPGLTFDVNRYRAATNGDRARLVLATSYHTAYVMGILCAVALKQGRAPPAAVPPARRSQGAAASLLPLVSNEIPEACWRAPFAGLGSAQRDSVATLLLTVILRRARTQGDVKRVREALEVALVCDLIDGPVPSQAAALLRRSQALASWLQQVGTNISGDCPSSSD